MPPESLEGAPAIEGAPGAATLSPSPPSAGPDSAKTKARRRAAWRTISDVAPETKVHASKIEATHKALRRELKAARRAIVESRYGEVEMPDMTPQQRIQNRNVHAAYSFVMRQQKGREKELERAQQFTTR